MDKISAWLLSEIDRAGRDGRLGVTRLEEIRAALEQQRQTVLGFPLPDRVPEAPLIISRCLEALAEIRGDEDDAPAPPTGGLAIFHFRVRPVVEFRGGPALKGRALLAALDGVSPFELETDVLDEHEGVELHGVSLRYLPHRRRLVCEVVASLDHPPAEGELEQLAREIEDLWHEGQLEWDYQDVHGLWEPTFHIGALCGAVFDPSP